MIIEDDRHIATLLRSAKTIALVGASPKPWRDSNSIMGFLRTMGYTVYPVNPRYKEVNGVSCHATLRELPSRIDIVNVFRRPDALLPLVDDAIAVRPNAIWLQLGVINEEAARRVSEAGISVIMDRCIAVEYRRLMRSVL